jgi:hypothetical protein
MGKTSHLALAAVLSLAAAAHAAGQAEAGDPFDAGAFAAATSSSPNASTSAARTEYLAGGEVLVSASASFPSDFGGSASSSLASGKLFAKATVPDSGSLYAAYGITQAFFEALSGDGAAALAPGLDLAAPSLVPTELYYSFDVDKLLFLRLGKQLLAWGPSKVWSPVDFVNGQRSNFFASVDLRQGESGLKLLLPIGKANATVFADFSGLGASELAGAAGFRATRVAGRLDAAVGGFELGLSGLVAPEAQDRAGFDFSGDLWGAAVYCELAFAPAYSSYSPSAAASLGLSRALDDLKRWTLSAEGFYESTGADRSGDVLAMASLTPLYMGRYYGYASLRADELLSRYLTTTWSGLANFSDLSYTASLREDFSFPRSPVFSLIVSYSGGGAGKEFTFLGGDGALSLSAQTLIEF